MINLEEHLHRQIAFSKATFGPGRRTEGVLDHITKEIEEVRNAQDNNERSKEWVDLVILSLDGLLREISASAPNWGLNNVAAHATDLINSKQIENELRTWPDWRTADPDKAIEHDRSRD